MDTRTLSDYRQPARPRGPGRKPRSRRLLRQDGSAYIAVLLVLVLLTIFGLSLVLITSTERQIGANQQLIQRIFYAADSGIHIRIATLLHAGSLEGERVALAERPISAVLSVRDEVETSRMAWSGDRTCDLCQINQGSEQKVVNYFYTTTSRRLLGNPANFNNDAERANMRIVAQREIDMMVELQPWELGAGDIYDPEVGVGGRDPVP